ncbi:ATP-binding response regulator [Spirochaeta dissipatitropha]
MTLVDALSSPASVLVVEDEHIVALDIQTSLQRCGFILFSVCQSGEAAIQLLEQSPHLPDIVLMDIHLAGHMDGIQTADHVIQNFFLPVIILTAYSDQKTITQALGASPYGYLVKPFDIRDLKTTITIALLRHRVEQETLQAKELLFSAVEGLPDGIMISDESDRVIEVNQKFSQMFGIQKEDVSARISSEIFSDFGLRIDGSPCQVEGHNDFWLEIYIRPLQGNVARKIYIFRDVSQRVAAERDLKRTQQRFRYTEKMEALGRMSEGIAHDFNNFLAIISGHMAVLQQSWDDIKAFPDSMNADPGDRLDNSIGGAQAAVKRSGSLVKQLLAFSRNYVTRMSSFRLDSLLDQLEKDLPKLLIGDFNVKIHKRAGEAQIYAHYSSVEQVLINLVLNARDAMHTGGTISISSGTQHIDNPLETVMDSVPPGDYLVVSVVDEGSGIQKEMLEHVFEPFYSTKEGNGCSGLGLSIVYGIVKQSKGYIQINTVPGKGTAFDIYFPLHAAPT